MNTVKQNFKFQKYIAIISIVLFLVKLVAWYITHSVAILTDAFESIVNVVAGLIGLYSLYISGKPKDLDHPYGHGKVEFLSAAIEGALVGIAGILIIIITLTVLVIMQGDMSDQRANNRHISVLTRFQGGLVGSMNILDHSV